MTDELRIFERPTLVRPVLVGAFRGWNDGGQAATLAAGYLARLWGARKFAEIDPELFVDFQATRPMVSLEDGQTRKIEWPENTFFRAAIPGANRDAVVLVHVVLATAIWALSLMLAYVLWRPPAVLARQ
ncbi:MAG TPA: PAC2 family protein [Gaiellaceae bacterium]|nr:PAC2 family protein [Gaiellaceae bacterium]